MGNIQKDMGVTDEKELKELSDLLKKDELAHEALGKLGENGKRKTSVRVTPERDEAWLYLAKPETADEYSTESILALLAQNGVIKGYIMSNIIAMVKKGVYERAIKVASTVLPKEGHDGWYEYSFDVDKIQQKKPIIRADGSVDYSSMSLLANVSKDTVVARYHPAVEGTDGELVDGTKIPRKTVKDLPPLKGSGFSNVYNPNEYVAQFDGKLEYKEGIINIRNVHQINGDVTMIIGKVEFYGDIIISGNVEAGVIIRAGKTLTIEGTIEGADIAAGSDIVLKRGIQGANRGKVVSGGNVFADFIEHTNVNAKGNVEANTILNSKISAEGKVILTGKKGTLVGGYTHARRGISAVNMGNTVEVKTIAHVGLENKDYEKNQELMKQDMEIREKLLPIIDEMTVIVKQRKIREITEMEENKLIALNHNKEELVARLKENQMLTEKMNEIVEQASGAEIRIEGNIYRGVVIAVDTLVMPIENNTCYMSYQNVGGNLEGSVIVRN